MADAVIAPVAILFVDIAGSTGLYGRLGNTAAKGLVTACLDLLRAEVTRFHGEVVQAIGDELMCRFPSAELGCEAAIAMQQRIALREIAAPVPLKVRIGLDWGEVLSEGNNLYGDAVNTAARLAHVAEGGQIMTSERVISQAGAAVGDRSREIGALPLKGKDDPLTVYEVLCEARDLTSITATRISRQPIRRYQLILRFGAERITLGLHRRSVTIGREAENDLVIPYAEVSRFHATVESRLDKFYLIDHSTNGTTVLGPDQNGLTLHREETPLTGRGEILCGFAYDPDEPHYPVRYQILLAEPSPSGLQSPIAPPGS